MGVGAIFISTLARLAIPDGEAEKDTAQVDNLKETIIPIVSFLVLSSVASRKLLSLGRG
jgi:NhaP-type Na+/H+ or K+/H+ antiporter